MSGSSRVARLKRKLRNERPEADPRIQAKAVGYVRVSTGGQVDGYGLDMQEDAIRSFARSQGYDLLSVIADGGVSGAMAPLEREGFKDIATLAERSAFSILLLYKFDRLARDVLHAVTTAHLLRDKYGVAIRSVTEPIDTATPMGEMIFAVLAGMAAQERHVISERTWSGRRQKAKEGGYACGGVPFGYDVDGDRRLIVNLREAELVRRIFTAREAGATLQQIADGLNHDGMTTKRGNPWRAGGIAHILDNPIYRGEVEYLFTSFGYEHVLRDGAHEAIVPATATPK